jgi:hypothetical protein
MGIHNKSGLGGGYMNGTHSNQFGHSNSRYQISAWDTAMLSAPADGPNTQVFKYSGTDYDFDVYNAQRWWKVNTSAWEQFTDELESVEGFKYPKGGGDIWGCLSIITFILIAIGSSVIFSTASDSYRWLGPVFMFTGSLVMITFCCCASFKSNARRVKRLSDIKAVIQLQNASLFHPVGYSMLLGSESAYFQLIDNGKAVQHDGIEEQHQGFNQQPNHNQKQNFQQPGKFNLKPQQYNTYPQQPNDMNNVNVNYPSYPGNYSSTPGQG